MLNLEGWGDGSGGRDTASGGWGDGGGGVDTDTGGVGR